MRPSCVLASLYHWPFVTVVPFTVHLPSGVDSLVLGSVMFAILLEKAMQLGPQLCGVFPRGAGWNSTSQYEPGLTFTRALPSPNLPSVCLHIPHPR